MRPVLTEKQVEEMKRLRESGLFLHEIARRFCVSTATAFNYCENVTTGRAREARRGT